MTYHKKSTWEWTGRGYFGEWRAEGLRTWLELRKEIRPGLFLTIRVLWWFCFLALTLVNPANYELVAEGIWLALSWYRYTSLPRLCNYFICWNHPCAESTTNRTDFFLLWEGLMERHINLRNCYLSIIKEGQRAYICWLFIYLNETPMVSRSVIVAGQLRKCEDSVIPPLVASVVPCTGFWSHPHFQNLSPSNICLAFVFLQ